MHERWREAEAWAEACRLGDCGYAHPRCQPTDFRHQTLRCPPDHSHGCPGYAGFKHVEHGTEVMRYRYCRRREAWVEATRARLRLEKGTPTPRPPKPWEG